MQTNFEQLLDSRRVANGTLELVYCSCDDDSTDEFSEWYELRLNEKCIKTGRNESAMKRAFSKWGSNE